jgi:hypothetical protein
MTPLPHFPVITPLGPATCVGILDDQDDVEWVTWILATGEPWLWRNPHVRLRRNVTNGLLATSPFSGLNEPTLKQIERYKQNGWLPANYDPGKPETWRL